MGSADHFPSLSWFGLILSDWDRAEDQALKELAESVPAGFEALNDALKKKAEAR